jgi:hypothetical protein
MKRKTFENLPSSAIIPYVKLVIRSIKLTAYISLPEPIFCGQNDCKITRPAPPLRPNPGAQLSTNYHQVQV